MILPRRHICWILGHFQLELFFRLLIALELEVGSLSFWMVVGVDDWGDLITASVRSWLLLTIALVMRVLLVDLFEARDWHLIEIILRRDRFGCFSRFHFVFSGKVARQVVCYSKLSWIGLICTVYYDIFALHFVQVESCDGMGQVLVVYDALEIELV